MINTYHSSLPPPVPPRLGRPAPASAGHSKPLLRFLVGIIVLNMLLSLGVFAYQYHTNNKLQDEIQLKSQGDELDRLAKRCKADGQSLPNCQEILDKYKSMTQGSPVEGGVMSLSGGGPSYRAMARMIVQQPVGTSIPTSKYLQWNMGHSVLRNISYFKSSWLTVRQPGDYFIHSRVTFSKWNPRNPLVSRVKIRESKTEKDRDLMMAYCSLGNQSSVCTASQGEVWTLKPGNQLSVWVLDPALVDYEEGATTFGLYKMN